MHTHAYPPVQPQPRRSKWRARRRKLAVFTLLLVAIYVGALGVFIPAHAVVATTTATSTPSTITVPLSWPASGQAAVGAEGYGVLASHNTDHPLPTASVIKTLMALAVLQKHPLQLGETGPTITMTQQDVISYQWYLANHGSVIPVRAGQKLTEYQALQAALIRSANNMADTLAIWAFGSLSEYHNYANDFAAQLGLTNTTIGSDASGLNPSTTSTASDLVRLGQIAMNNPVIAEIVGQSTTTIPEVGIVHNTNNLLGLDGIIGIKTGTDYQNKGVYLFACRYQVTATKQVLIIGAVMGAHSITSAKQESLALLASAKKGFAKRTLFKAGTTVGSYAPIWSGNTIRAHVAQDIQVVDWMGRPLETSITLNNVRAPLKAGAVVGHISIVQDGHKKVVGSVTLDKDIDRPSLWWRLSHPHTSLQLYASD